MINYEASAFVAAAAAVKSLSACVACRLLSLTHTHI